MLRAGEFPPSEARLGRRAVICCTVLAVVFGALSMGATPAIAAKQPTPPAATKQPTPPTTSKKPVIPSQSQIDKANVDAQAKATQIGQTQAQLAAANVSLQSLNDHVEMLVEAYDHATADVDAAQQGVESATQDLANATRDRLDAQVQMSVFAANSYRGGGSLDRMSALMTADSPALFMTRASTLTALAHHEQSVIARLQTTEEQQTAAQAAANAALTNRIGAAAVASKAKDQAIDAVNSQALGIAQINAQQQDLQAQLAVLQGTAKDLATARAQGLRRLAEEAAARAAAAAAAVQPPLQPLPGPGQRPLGRPPSTPPVKLPTAAIAAVAVAIAVETAVATEIAAATAVAAAASCRPAVTRFRRLPNANERSRLRRRRSAPGIGGPASATPGRRSPRAASRTFLDTTVPA